MTIIEQLLAIENDAQETIKNIQNTTLIKSAQLGLQKKIIQLEAETTSEITRREKETQAQTTRRIEEVKEKYRKKLLHEVLYGGKL